MGPARAGLGLEPVISTGPGSARAGQPAWAAMRRRLSRAARLSAFSILLAMAAPLAAQSPATPPAAPTAPTLSFPGLSLGEGTAALGIPMQILLLLTLLTLLPAAVSSLTPFLRIVVVLHFLRQAIGTQTAPGNQTLLGLALFLTAVLMRPVADQVHIEAIVPLQAGEIGHIEALEKAGGPIKRYLTRFVREEEVALFIDITGKPRPKNLADLDLMVLMPAYVLSELRVSFQIGAVLFLPFLVIDLLVASITLSLGMIQLPPVMISMPFKLLLFVLVDGWNLVVGSLVRGFY